MPMNINTITLLGYIHRGSELSKGFNIVKSDEEMYREHYIGASAISYCGVKIYHDYVKDLPITPEDFSVQTKRIFRLGHILESELLHLIKLGGGLVTGTQLSFKDFDGIFRGHCDGILDKSSILEIKSMNDASYNVFSSCKTQKDIAKEFKSYYIQINLYTHYFNKPDGFILAYNKNTSEVGAFRVVKDLAIIEQARQKAKSICYAKSATELVKYINEEECIWCPYKKLCQFSK